MKKLLLMATGLLLTTAANAADVTVSKTTGDLALSPSYASTYTGSGDIDVIIRSTKPNGNTANNMNWNGDNVQIHSGDTNSSTYTLTCKDANYYVSSYSFTATAVSGNQSLTIQGGDAVALSTTEAKTFSSGHIAKGTTASFVLSGTNVGTVLTDFTVTLTHRVKPEEEGWYVIKGTFKRTPYFVENANAEYRQSNTNAYSLKLVNAYSESQPAARFIKIKPVSDTKIVVTSANGHYLNNNTTSNRNSVETNFEVMEVADFAARIGGVWSIYGDNNGSERPYLGSSSGDTANRHVIEKAYPEEMYDIWTVSLVGTTNAAEIQNDVRLTLNHVENKGLSSVYNNGTFFVTKGTELHSRNFSAPENNGNANPLITVDNDAHTVTVDYTQDAGDRAAAEQALEAYKNEKFAALAATPIISAVEISELLKNIVIPADATDLDAALAAAKTEVDNYDMLPEVITRVDGRKIYMRSLSGSNGTHNAMAGAESGTVGKHFTDLGLESVWVLNFTEGNTMSMHNLAYNNYIGGKNGDNAMMSADPVELKFDFAPGNYGAFRFCNASITNDNKFLNQANGNNVHFYLGASSNAGSHWSITFVDAAFEQPYVDAIMAKYPANIKVGTNPGNVNVNMSHDDFEARKAQAAAQVAGNLDYPVAKNLLALDVPAVLGVETGRLIRVKNSTGAHYFGMTETASVFNSTDPENSIFYYSPSKRLVNLKHGVGAKRAANNNNNGHQLTSRTTAEQNVDFETNTHALTIENGTTTATSHQCAIYWDFPERPNFPIAFFAYINDGNIGCGAQTSHSALVEAQGNDYLTTWSFLIEYVNEVPVAIGADECGSIVAPVALKIPATDGFNFYECVTEGNVLKFCELAAETIVSAETPVLVWRTAESTAEVVNIPVCYDAPAEAAALADEETVETPAAANRFAGSYLTLPNADAEGAEMITYVKASDITPGADDAQEIADSKDTSVAFKRAEGTIPAGAVTVKIIKDSEEIPDAVMLSLNGENTGTTAITSVEVAPEATAGAIYDLQGRRLAAPVKGINIINGKKVLVK